MFQFLFKYRPLLFQRGHVVFGTPWIIPLLLLLLGVALAVVAYRRAPGRAGRTQRLGLAGLRAGAVALLALVVARPILVVPTVVPQQNFLAVLVDDSRSMQIQDQGAKTRGGAAADLLSPNAALLGRLEGQFKVRLYRFSSTAERVASAAELGFAGDRTNLAAALDRVRQDLSGAPLAGVVAITDGADNAGASLDAAALQLKAARVPVYAVGLGRERAEKDIELSRLDLPRTAVKGSTLIADVLLAQSGFDRASVPIAIEESGQIVAMDTVRMPREGTLTVHLPFTLTGTGPRAIRVRVPPQPGEQVAENNVRSALVYVDDRRNKVLYFEGEPRFEAKFLRQALQDDQAVQLVVLQRTAEDKFLRLDVDSPEDLVAGFPKTREELFRYRGLILGSVEASQFTHDQLQMIRDFVGERGGGLLLLGGRLSFAEGGYAGTPVADVVPFKMPAAERAARAERAETAARAERAEGAGDSTADLVEVHVEPTPAGLAHPAMQLAGSADASANRWESLPSLTVVNRIGTPKPGSTVLLTGHPRGGGSDVPVLGYERYGRGKALALTVQDSWLWQMHADIPVDDQTHEALWRQLLRWLVSGVPEPVTVTLSADRVEPGDSVSITASVADSAFAGVNGASVTARVETPLGREQRIPLQWTVLRDGEYRGSFSADARGTYHVTVEAQRTGGARSRGEAYVEAGSLGAEFFGAGMRRDALERLAQGTGGRFYTPETASTLPEDVRYTESGAAVLEQHELWDMPVTFLLLLALLGVEWGWRRARGLA